MPGNGDHADFAGTTVPVSVTPGRSSVPSGEQAGGRGGV
jgi:hypothetical protein